MNKVVHLPWLINDYLVKDTNLLSINWFYHLTHITDS
jgi:hypothetical protein